MTKTLVICDHSNCTGCLADCWLVGMNGRKDKRLVGINWKKKDKSGSDTVNLFNKKVLLHERKRHAAVYQVLTVLFCPGEGGGGVLQSCPGLRYPSPVLVWGTPGWVHPAWDRVPSPGTEVPSGRDLGPVAGVPPDRTYNQWKYYGMEMGTPPPPGWPDKRTENITFPNLWMWAVRTCSGEVNEYRIHWLKCKSS